MQDTNMAEKIADTVSKLIEASADERSRGSSMLLISEPVYPIELLLEDE